MAKSHLKSVSSKTRQDQIVNDLRTCLWRIEALARAVYFDSMDGSSRLSDEDKGNIAATIDVLAGEGHQFISVLEEQTAKLLEGAISG